MTNLMQSVKDNLAFLGVCLVIVVAIFVVAGLTEKALRQKIPWLEPIPQLAGWHWLAYFRRLRRY